MSDEKRSFDFPSRAKPDVRYRWYRRYYDAEFDTFRRDLAVDAIRLVLPPDEFARRLATLPD